MFSNTNTILSDIELTYKKMLFDLLQSAKTDSIGNKSLAKKLADDFVAFLNALETPDQDKKKKLLLDRIKSYKTILTKNSDSNDNVELLIIESAQQDIEDNAKRLMIKLNSKENASNLSNFKSDINKINDDESYTPQTSMPKTLKTGFIFGSVSSYYSKMVETLSYQSNTSATKPKMTSTEEYNEQYNKAMVEARKFFECGVKKLKENAYHQSIENVTKAINCSKEIDQKFKENKAYISELIDFQNQLALALLQYAKKLLSEDQYDGAIPELELALSTLSEIQNQNNTSSVLKAECYKILANIYYNSVDIKKAIKYYELALNSYFTAKLNDENSRKDVILITKKLSGCCIELGNKHYRANDFNLADAAYQSAIIIIEKFDQTDIEVLSLMETAYVNLGKTYSNQAKIIEDQIDVEYDINTLEKKLIYDKAIEMFKKVINLNEKMSTSPAKLNKIKEKLIALYDKRGQALSDLGKFEEAIDDIRTAIALCHGIFSNDSHEIRGYKSSLSSIQRKCIYQLIKDENAKDNEDQISDEENSGEQEDVNKNNYVSKKRTADPFLNTIPNKKQKIESKNQVLVTDILSRHEEVIQIMNDLEYEDPRELVHFYQRHHCYTVLEEKFNTSINTTTPEELTCYSMPLLFNNINEIDTNTLDKLITQCKDKLSINILANLQLIRLALQYQQALINISERGQQIQPVTKIDNDMLLKLILFLLRYQQALINRSELALRYQQALINRSALEQQMQSLIQSTSTSSKPYENINLSHATLTYINLPNSKLEFAHLDHANLNNANFYNASLENARLVDSSLKYAILSDASLNYADLDGADFTNADMVNADLSHTSCVDCNFSNANLTNAKFIGANLANTNLQNANLSGAVFINPVMYKEGVFSKHLSYLLNNFVTHKQKDLLFTAVINDILNYLVNQNLTIALEFIKETQTVLSNINLQGYLGNNDDNNSNNTFFAPRNTVRVLLEKLSECQKNIEDKINKQQHTQAKPV